MVKVNAAPRRAHVTRLIYQDILTVGDTILEPLSKDKVLKDLVIQKNKMEKLVLDVITGKSKMGNLFL